MLLGVVIYTKLVIKSTRALLYTHMNENVLTFLNVYKVKYKPRCSGFSNDSSSMNATYPVNVLRVAGRGHVTHVAPASIATVGS